MEIFDILQELRSDNSRLFKESVLKREVDNALLKMVFERALDPMLQFHVRKIPSYKIIESDQYTLVEAISDLAALSSRKVTGNAAIQHLANVLGKCSLADAEVVKLIIDKDLDCGVNVSTVNKIWKDLIKEIPYMRCSQIKDIPEEYKNKEDIFVSQVKADGMFVNVNVYPNRQVDIYSRNGRHFEVARFSNIVDELLAILDNQNLVFENGVQFHGELLVLDNNQILPREIGNGALNSVLKGGRFDEFHEPMLSVWDMIPLEAAVPGGSYQVPYIDRYNKLVDTVSGLNSVQIIETRFPKTLAEAYDHYFECIEKNLEGTIIKIKDAIWEDKTSKKQFKVKVEFDCDLKIVGFKPGKGKNEATFGSLICASDDGILEVDVPGFTDKMRKEWWDKRDKMIGRIIAVKSNNITNLDKEIKSLFLPRFLELREDKHEADTFERIVEQFNSVVKRK